MPRGLPKKYAKMGFKKGWIEYKKSKKDKFRSESPKKATKKRRVTKKPTGGSKVGKRPWYIAPLLGAIGVPLTLIITALSGLISWQAMLGKLTACYTGYDPWEGAWDPGMALANYGAIGTGTIASTIASKVGLNRRLPAGFNI